MQLPDLNDYINHRELFRETVNGINKDFMQLGEQGPVPEDIPFSFENLVNLLMPVLNGYFTKNQHLFQAILYRVDISETLLLEAIKGKQGDQLIREVAVLIIKRELQKAVMRRLF